MSLSVKREIVANVNGAKVVLAPEELKQETFLEFTCAGPRCASRNGDAVRLSWIEEEVTKNVSLLPDKFFSIIKIQPDPIRPEDVEFVCGPQCAKDWLTYSYVPPKSSRQLKAEIEVTAAAKAALESQLELPFEGENDATQSAAQPI